MQIDFWAPDSPFLLAPPLRTEGMIQLGLTALALLVLVLPPLLRDAEERRRARAGRIGLLLALMALAPLAELLLYVQLAKTAILPGLPLEPATPGFSPLAPLPWMAAAGLLGAPQAALVAFAGGLVRGGWVTGSLMTPLSVALQAALTASLLRLPYREWIAKAIRQPLGAACAGGLLYGLLRAGELFGSSGGSLYDGVNFALTLWPAVLLAALLEALVAGVGGELLRRRRRDGWPAPGRLVPGPYNRSLAARMVSTVLLLGLVSVAGLAVGQWLLARGAIRQLVADRMQQSAQQAGDDVPFFITSGRTAVREQAEELAARLALESAPQDPLALLYESQSFFRRVALFDRNGALLAQLPAEGSTRQTPVELAAALSVAMQGVPQEVVLPPETEARGADLVFVAPVREPGSGEVLGVIGGWTSLADHPLLNSLITQVVEPGVGVTVLVDNRGTVLLHADPAAVLDRIDLGQSEPGAVVLGAAPDGTRRLEYVYAIPGYSWRVVSRVPQRVVDRTAMPIAARLLAVLLAVGVAFLAFVYWSSRRLTRPLRAMAHIAEAIARGDLERPVKGAGADEVGRLAASFERMRQGLKSRLEQMDLLLEVSQSLASELDLNRSLPTVLAGLRRLTGAETARLALGSPLEDWGLEPEVLQAGGEGDWAQLDQPISELCRQRGAFKLENPARARAVLNLESVTVPVGALTAAPVHSEDGYLGALWTGRRDRIGFEQADTNLVAIVAAQLGVWLSNVALFRQAEGERERVSALLEVTPDAVIAVDREGHIALANPAAEILLNTSREQAVGRPASEVVVSEEVQRLLLERAGDEHTAEIVLEEGPVLSASAREIWAGGDRTGGRMCVLWDITHFRKLDKLKSEFVATVSHDLRAPLTLMRGYATMISMVGAVNEQQKEFVAKILDSIDGMSQLVENLLDLGRIEAGLGLELEEIQVADLVQKVISTFRPQAVNKKVALDVRLDEGLVPIRADPTLLRQAVANLLDNAIKYTPGGGEIILEAKTTEGELVLAVTDTGVGVAPADQARLFERFYRARRPESVQTRGSGLGLAIVRSIAERHGGGVTVESRLGAGSTFTLRIPSKAGEPKGD